MVWGVGFVAMRNFEPLKRLQVREPLLTNLAGVWHRRLLPVVPGIQSTLSGSHLILLHHKWFQSRKSKGQIKEERREQLAIWSGGRVNLRPKKIARGISPQNTKLERRGAPFRSNVSERVTQRLIILEISVVVRSLKSSNVKLG